MISFCLLVVVFSQVGVIFAVVNDPQALPIHSQLGYRHPPPYLHDLSRPVVPHPQAHQHTSDFLVPPLGDLRITGMTPQRNLPWTKQNGIEKQQSLFLPITYDRNYPGQETAPVGATSPINALLHQSEYPHNAQASYQYQHGPQPWSPVYPKPPQMPTAQVKHSGRNLLTVPSQFEHYNTAGQDNKPRGPAPPANPTAMHNQLQQNVERYPASSQQMYSNSPQCYLARADGNFRTRNVARLMDFELQNSNLEQPNAAHVRQDEEKITKARHVPHDAIPTENGRQFGRTTSNRGNAAKEPAEMVINNEYANTGAECDRCGVLRSVRKLLYPHVSTNTKMVAAFQFYFEGIPATVILDEERVKHIYNEHCENTRTVSRLYKTQWTEDVCKQLALMKDKQPENDICRMITTLLKSRNKITQLRTHFHGMKDWYAGQTVFQTKLGHTVGIGRCHQNLEEIKLIIAPFHRNDHFKIVTMFPVDNSGTLCD